MDRQRPRPSARSRPWPTLCAAASLAACQMLPPQLTLSAPPAEPAPAWRVVERLGEARYLAPSMAGWEQIAAGSLVPAGSQITTGSGGRLIVHQDDNQLNAGTGSRFILPGREPGATVRQTAGWLRYRIASPSAATFGIETPFLDLLVDDAVVDVTVGDSETEVTVVSGQVRVKTLDGRRQIDLHAGYTGYASLEGDPLAVRRGAGQGLERVPPTVLPALHPDRAASNVSTPVGVARGAVDPAAAGASVSAAIAAAVPASTGPSLIALAGPAPTTAPMTPPAMVSEPTETVVTLPLTAVVAAPAPPPATDPATIAIMQPASAKVMVPAGFSDPPSPEASAAQVSAAEAARAEIRQRFDTLTEGLLDGLPPAPQSDRR